MKVFEFIQLCFHRIREDIPLLCNRYGKIFSPCIEPCILFGLEDVGRGDAFTAYASDIDISVTMA